jgi:hypothetical protein
MWRQLALLPAFEVKSVPQACAVTAVARTIWMWAALVTDAIQGLSPCVSLWHRPAQGRWNVTFFLLA